jgi:anti-sigma regulatory factor (Ser/Thr protein kinase)
MEAGLPCPDLPATVQADQTLFQVPSLPDWIAPTVEYLRQRALLSGACEEARTAKLTLALHEALSNSIIHGNLEVDSALKERGDHSFPQLLARRAADPAYAGRAVTIEVAYDGERCQWAMTDEGKGFDHERLLNRAGTDEADLWRASGRGILMMRTFVDELRYELGGRRVVMATRRDWGTERRRQPRAPLQRLVRVAPIQADGSVDWGLAQQAVTRNLSSDGMAVLQARLAASERVLLALEDEQGRPLFLPAQVRHCRAVHEGLVELGCQFLPRTVASEAVPAATPALEEAVDALLQGLAAGHERKDDRREHPRVGYAECIEVYSPHGGPPLLAYSRNLSPGGIAFLSPVPVALGPRVLALLWRDRPPLRLRADVIRCVRITDGFYDVAARFQGLEEDCASHET